MRSIKSISNNPFQNKWIAILLGVSVLPSLIFLLLFSFSSTEKIISERKKVGESISSLLPSFLSEDFSYNDYSSIIQKISHLKKHNNLDYVEVFNSIGGRVFIKPIDFEIDKSTTEYLHFNVNLKSGSGSIIGKVGFGLSLKDELLRRNSMLWLIGFACFLFVVIEAYLIFFMMKKLLTPSVEIMDHLSNLSKGIYSKFDKYQNVKDERRQIGENYNKILSSILDYQEQLKQATKNQAIISTTQMLAHDVRKPFSQVKLILSSFERLKSNPSVLNRAKKDVDKAIRNVESMVSDIMDISREVDLKTEPKSLGNIFDFVIRQVFQEHPDVYISLDYSFNAKYKPLVDEERIARVFTNILGNAIEAITVIGGRDKGNIIFKTEEITPNSIEITIFNDGPSIPDRALPNLFESSYTSGKNKGTGLGLASAKKIVSLHKGEILAKNIEGKGVEFVVRLPISSRSEKIDLNRLPINSSQLHNLNDNLSGAELLLKQLEEQNKSFKVLLLEDEVLYRAWVKNLINDNPTLQKCVVLYDASTVDEALQLVENEKLDFAIVDIDLGEEKNGYDFLQAVQSNENISCIVHSNRTIQEDKDKALRLGAKNFIPKPLPLESLILFLCGEVALPHNIDQITSKQVKVVYGCDDTELIRIHLEDILKSFQNENPDEIEYELFKTGEELLEKAKDRKPDLVLTDLNMGDAGGILSGYDVIKRVKEMAPQSKVYLTSNEPISLSEEPTKAAGGDGSFEQPLSREVVLKLLKNI